MARLKLTSIERIKAREIVIYELCMLRKASKMYLDKTRARDDACFGSALLDSALLHVRSLYEFLTHKPFGNLIVARDFLDDDSNWEPSGLAFVKQCNKYINIFRSHVSRPRIDNTWTWEDKLPRIVNDIEAALRSFINELPIEEHSEWKI